MTETRAIKAAFGDQAYQVPISSPKSMVGHLVGAAGIASALAALGAIRDQVIPPTVNLEHAGPGMRPRLRAARRRARRRSTPSMINGFGFGGQNAVAVFRRVVD